MRNHIVYNLMGVAMQDLARDGAPEEALSFNNQVCFPLYSAANAVVRAYREPLAKLDLTYLQYMALLVLWEQGDLPFKTLCLKLRLDSGTLTPMLKRLEAKGLVRRARAEADERVRLIELTDKGRALKAEAADVPYQVVCTLGLPVEKLETLRHLCNELLDAMREL